MYAQDNQERRRKKSELPSTLKKSSAKAQRTFAKAHDSAAKEYGEGERAHRVAYSALKHSFEKKVGDHWEPKSSKGPSDARARSGGPNAKGKTAEAWTPTPARSICSTLPSGWISADGRR